TGLDHARTLATVWPRLQMALKESKKEKLLQFAARVWNITEKTEADPNLRISQAIANTDQFFQSLGVKTHLSDYGLALGLGEQIAERFSKRGVLNLGEKGEITPNLACQIVNQSY
ncbi:MAG: iron-containing alcohol dehydrogenase, partial [Bacteroidales bacterium]